jgi:hypothetical protein
MEKKVFFSPSVAPLLTERFVEARLHLDKDSSPAIAAMRGVRDRYLGSGNIAAPIYMLLDPADPDRPLAFLRGAATAEAFAAFLHQGLPAGATK